MKNILFILPWLPYPMKSGGHQAIYNGIKAICKDANIVITYITEEKDYNTETIESFVSTLNTNIQVEPFIIKEVKRKGFSLLLHKVHIEIWKVKQYLLNRIKKSKKKNNNTNIDICEYLKTFYPKSNSYINHINKLIEKNSIDIVQCEMLGNCSIILNLSQQTKNVFVHHEIGFIRNEQEIKTRKCTDYSTKAFWELSKIQEIGLLNKYNAVITLSENDKNILKNEGVETAIFPSIAIIDNNYTYNQKSDKYNILTFIGPEFHTPNLLGIKWFLENCWKSLKKKDNTYILKIIGNWSKETQKILCKEYEDIQFCGYVNDLTNELRDSIMIVPLTVGSGIRMKILEAASIGVPIVTTTIGVSGIKMYNEKHCYIGDTPKEFVNSIIALKEKEKRIQIIKNANNLIIQEYSLEALRNNRLNIYNNII